MTMSLKQVVDAIRLHSEGPRGQYENMDRDDLKEWADTIEGYLSQPQPVAQGEAVAYMRITTHANGVKSMSFGTAEDHFYDDEDKAAGQTWVNIPLYTTPHTPTHERKPCPGCKGERGGLGVNMGYVPCRDCDGAGFIECDDDIAPTIPTGHRVVPVPFAIDRTHKNQAFVTMGFDSVDNCTAFIKAVSSHRHVLAASPSAGGV